MRIFLRLTAYALRYKRRLAAAYICLLGASISYLVIPKILGEAIDATLRSGASSQLLLLAIAILGISAVRGIFAYGQTYLAESLSQRVAYDIRNAFYDHLQRLSFAYHDQQHTGNLMSRATADVENIRTFTSMGLVRSLYFFLLLVIVSVLLVQLHWQLGLLSISIVPILIAYSIKVSFTMRRIWLQVQEMLGQLTTILQENLAGARVVKAFGAEEYENGKFDKKAWEVTEESLQANRIQASNSALMTFTFTLALGLILWFGGRQVIQGNLTAGQLAQFIFYMGILAMPVRTAGWLVSSYSRALSSGERIFYILDTESPVKEKRNAKELPRRQGHVRFEHVSFSYDSSAPVLTNISLEAKPGQVIALLGSPGSGKSTIVHLLPRFYDVTEGGITIDGIDIRDVTLASLRRNVGIVLQDVFLFNSTIGENITYGAVEASKEDVVRVAKIAQLHDFIQGLPEGYDTWVGERGVTLSGGQRQRLAIARTLLLDPPILILDDSTSSVDAETEHRIRQALDSVMRGRTTLVIAHRLSTVHTADLILVLKDGEIVERGTHRELLGQEGLYREIYDLQLRPKEEIMLETSLKAESGRGLT
ncbi:MAG: ABC transporter ATP-binding protein [Chloroflexi bacterium]|nr:ABC transporter ATP-binding protein [Chloroflexota bacterium]